MLSPRTQMLAQSAGVSPDAEASFKEQFATMAHQHFNSKHPELGSLMVDFKVVDVDLEKDIGVGAVRLSVNNQDVHIPVVVSNGKIFPLSVMYFPQMETFLPFDEKWLGLVQANTGLALGSSAKPPKTLQSDQDIRHLMLPPQTGRYSYASASLPSFLLRAPNETKRQFVSLLEQSPKIARHLFRKYAASVVEAALAPTRAKTANTNYAKVGVYDETTPHEDLRLVFGKRASAAYYKIMNQGYAVYDERPDREVKVAVFRDNVMRFTTVENPGVHYVYKKNGTMSIAYISPQAVRLAGGRDHTLMASPPERYIDENSLEKPTQTQFDTLIYLEDGSCLCDAPNGFPKMTVGVIHDQRSALEKLFGNGNTNTKKGLGFYVGFDQGRVNTTQVMDVASVTRGIDGEVVYGYCPTTGKHICLRRSNHFPSNTINVIHSDRNHADVFVPPDYYFVPIRKTLSLHECAFSPIVVADIAHAIAERSGMEPLDIRNGDVGEFYIDGAILDKTASIKHLIVEYGLSVPSAERVMKLAEKQQRLLAYAADKNALHKIAQEGLPPDGAPVEEAPAGIDPASLPPEVVDMLMQQGIDPAQLAPEELEQIMMQLQGDPSMMGGGMAPEPPPPSPVDIAVQEVGQVISAQAEEIQRKMQQQLELTQAQLSAISMVQDRAQQIAQGAPPLEYNDIRALSEQNLFAQPEQPVEEAPPAPMPEQLEQLPPEVAEDAAMMAEDPSMQAAVQGQTEVPVRDTMDSAFDTAAIGALLNQDNISNFDTGQVDQFRETLDNTSRILLEVQIKAPILREQLGEQRYNEIVGKLTSVVEGLGQVLLSLYQHSLILNNLDA